MFRGVPGFLEGVPGCSGFSRRCSGVFRVFHTVPGVPGCSGVSRCSVFRRSGVPVFLELLHARYIGVPLKLYSVLQIYKESKYYFLVSLSYFS